ncbi:MAG: hypothetical protein LN563_00800 [Rickettsia endosymbiont of Platyusa sonomae]|nr:hypothetical protein [Rickettsia endosymbiont of Platyusa sonomae]
MPEILNYKELKNRLNKDIELMEIKIAIIDNLRTNKDKQATGMEYIVLLNSLPPLHSSVIALMLQAKSNARAEHGIDYQPVIIKDQESLDRLKIIVQQNVNTHQPFHYDLILQMPDPEREDVGHSTPLQIHSDGNNIDFFHIDAAGDKTNLPSILEVANTVNVDSKLYYKGIQKDSFSCATFSIQDLNSMANLGAETLNQSLSTLMHLPDGGYKISSPPDISKLPPRFVKNAQSSEAIRENLANEKNKTVIVSKNKTLEQHVEDYSMTMGVVGQIDAITKKQQNRAIDYKTLKYLQSARNELEKIYQKGGEELVQQVIAERTGGIIFSPRPPHELTKADKYKIMQSTKNILTSNHKDIISFNNEMDKFIDQLTVDKIGKQANEQDKQQIREKVEAKLEKIITKSPDEKEIFTQALQLMKQKDTVKDIGNIMHNQKLGNGSNKTTSLLRLQQQRYKAEYRNSM